ncbi:MAG: hypothetical protein ACOVMM_10590 [Chitinophagaceae bacterium]
MKMAKKILITFLSVLLVQMVKAQCSICTKTANQLGDGPAKDLNLAILYLMFMPLAIMLFIGYKWYKKNQSNG